jgi:CRP/FNR family transcriptional regulator, cyclic AMP receptor protein
MKLRSGDKSTQGQNSEAVEALGKVPLFSALDRKQLKVLANEGRQISYPEGKKIIEEGSTSIVFHLILDGEVEVKKKTKTLAKLGKGQFFGELGLLDDSPRSADVVTTTPTRCFAMTKWEWKSYLETTPSIAFEVMKVLARRLRETDDALAQWS